MQKLRKRLFNVKMLASLLIVGIFLGSSVFAAETSSSGVQNAAIAMNDVVSFLSWAWVFFAVLAGKLMSNGFIYGEFMNLDSFLWQMRNIMKNFANFTIGFMFLFYLIKNIFSLDDKQTPASFIKEKVVAFLVAGVLIQMSWFLVGAVIDVSTVATSAIGSFPASMIEDKTKYQGDLRTELERIRGLNITRDAQGATTNKLHADYSKAQTLTDDASKEELNKYLDAILPNQDSLSGPLLFMGMSLFKFQDFTSNENIVSGDWDKMFITGGIQLLLVVMFTLAMFILFLLNVARVVILWMVIVFVPFLILFTVLKSIGKSDIDILDKLNLPKLGQIIKMIFAPVIFTAFMSIMLILTFAVWGMLNTNQNRTLNEITFVESVETSSIAIDEVASSTVEGLKTGFADLLVYLLLIFLLWMFIKLSVNIIAKDTFIANKVINPLMQGVGKLPGSIPILPTSKGGISAGAIQKFGREQKQKISKKLYGDEMQAQKNAVSSWFGLGTQWQDDWSTQLKNNIRDNKTADFFSNSKSYAGAMDDGLTLAHGQRGAHVTAFLKKQRSNTSLPTMTQDDLTAYFAANPNAATEFGKQMGKSNGVTQDNIMTTKFGKK